MGSQRALGTSTWSYVPQLGPHVPPLGTPHMWSSRAGLAPSERPRKPTNHVKYNVFMIFYAMPKSRPERPWRPTRNRPGSKRPQAGPQAGPQAAPRGPQVAPRKYSGPLAHKLTSLLAYKPWWGAGGRGAYPLEFFDESKPVPGTLLSPGI